MVSKARMVSKCNSSYDGLHHNAIAIQGFYRVIMFLGKWLGDAVLKVGPARESRNYRCIPFIANTGKVRTQR